MSLSPTEIYRDRKLFLIGSTGFLGKVCLSMLLHRFPNVGRVYVTVRARSQEESETRFWNSVITAPPFNPLRERYGSALDGFLRDKVAIRGGDIGDDNLGYTDEEAQRVADDVDLVINTAGNVTFNPTLESGLRKTSLPSRPDARQAADDHQRQSERTGKHQRSHHDLFSCFAGHRLSSIDFSL